MVINVDQENSMQSYSSVVARTQDQRYQGSADIVIVGNGIAGLTAAVEARRLAPDMRIVMITEQCHPTINTPALKQFATGKLEREQLLAYPVGTERSQRIQVLHGRVEEINAQSKYVYLQGGGYIGYGVLLLATGSTANGLPENLPGRDFDGVLTLHRLQNYLDLRRRLNEVDEVAVVGGGLHAIETVTSLLHMGIQTHWFIRRKTCLSRVMDQRASAVVMKHIEKAGARIHCETEVVGIVGSVGTVAGVVTTYNQLISCQLVLVCTGTRPVTTLAEHCTQPMMYERDRGIFVNNQLRTSVPGIYAAGDVAAINNPQTGVHEIRAQWYAAVVQGCSAAAIMTGQHPSTVPPFGVPWHATRIGELAMLTVGNPLGRAEGSITLADSNKGTYRRLSLLDDRLIGYISLGTARSDGLAIKRLIDEGHSIRALKEPLLKGTFDGRKYFSQQHSTTVIAMTTGGNTSPLHSLYHSPAAPGTMVESMLVALPSSSAGSQSRKLLSYDRKRGH